MKFYNGRGWKFDYCREVRRHKKENRKDDDNIESPNSPEGLSDFERKIIGVWISIIVPLSIVGLTINFCFSFSKPISYVFFFVAADFLFCLFLVWSIIGKNKKLIIANFIISVFGVIATTILLIAMENEPFDGLFEPSIVFLSLIFTLELLFGILTLIFINNKRN